MIDTTGLTKMIPSEDTIPNYGAGPASLTIPHGFSAVPDSVRCVLKCVSPPPGGGYAADDEVDINSISGRAVDGARPFRVASDDENIFIRRHFPSFALAIEYGPGVGTLGTITVVEGDWLFKTYASYLAPKVPAIATQPTSLTRTAGTNATFTVVAGGDTPLTYQWQRNGVNIFDGGRLSGTGTASLTITGVVDGVPPGGDEANYSCVVTSAIGSVSSNTASLTVT